MRPIKVILTGASLFSLVGAFTLGFFACGMGGSVAGWTTFLVLLGVSILFGWLSRRVNF